jgi:hypothetical protein
VDKVFGIFGPFNFYQISIDMDKRGDSFGWKECWGIIGLFVIKDVLLKLFTELELVAFSQPSR